MNTLLLKMAQRASDDHSLMASVIQTHARQHQLTWPQVAAELTIEEEQLARLALCRRPNGQATAEEIRQIAAYVDMSSTELAAFIRRNGSTQTEARPLPPQPQPQRQRPAFAWPSFKWETNFMFKRRTIAFALASIAFLVFAAFAFAQPAGSQATLVVSAGQATVYQGETMFLIVPRQTQTTVAAGSILTVNQGDRIALPDDAAAQLSLYDGTIVDIAGGSNLELAELVTNDRTYRVQLSLAAGRTLNRVVKLLGTDDKFEVRTPSSTASVRGTIFTVAVISNTESYYAVDEGIVRVTMGGEFIDVHPGQAVMAVVGQPLTLMAQLPKDATGAPVAQPDPQTSEQDSDADADADAGTRANTPPTGIPATATPSAPNTAVPGSPINPAPVVTDTVPGPTVTPAPGTCTGTEVQPTGLTLAQRYGVSYDEIMGWFCAGFGFGTIDLAYSLSQETGADVAVIFTMSASGMGWGQIRTQLLGNPGGNNGNPGGNNGNPGGNNGNPGGNNGNPGGNNGNPGGNNGNPGGNSGDPGGNSGNPGNNDNGGQPPSEPPSPPAGPPENPPGNGGGNGNDGNGNNGNNGNGSNK
ncbi:MAG: FecR domain-containing protein [Anaerolineae bacterium]|nr:FecR domain-containing protein [Anaerolineae bacterium]